MLTFSDTEEKAVEKAVAALADMIPLEAVHSTVAPLPGTYFSGIGNQTTPTPGTEKWD